MMHQFLNIQWSRSYQEPDVLPSKETEYNTLARDIDGDFKRKSYRMLFSFFFINLIIAVVFMVFVFRMLPEDVPQQMPDEKEFDPQQCSRCDAKNENYKEFFCCEEDKYPLTEFERIVKDAVKDKKDGCKSRQGYSIRLQLSENNTTCTDKDKIYQHLTKWCESKGQYVFPSSGISFENGKIIVEEGGIYAVHSSIAFNCFNKNSDTQQIDFSQKLRGRSQWYSDTSSLSQYRNHKSSVLCYKSLIYTLLVLKSGDEIAIDAKPACQIDAAHERTFVGIYRIGSN